MPKPTNTPTKISEFKQRAAGRPHRIDVGDIWADRNDQSRRIEVVKIAEPIIYFCSKVGESRGAWRELERPIFTKKYIRVTMTPKKKKPVPAKVQEDRAEPSLAKVIAKEVAAPKKKFMPEDKTPFLEDLKNAVLPRMRAFEKSLLEVQEGENFKPLRILAIDPGTTNIALCFLNLETNEYITSKVERPEGFQFGPSQVRYREHILEQWIVFFRPDLIVKEQSIHGRIGEEGQVYGLVDSGRLQYMIERLAMDYQIPIITVNTQNMRKFIGATGTQHNKSDIKLRVFQRWGKEFQSEDECDAFAIAQTGKAIAWKEWSPSSRKGPKKLAKGSKK